MIFGKRCPNCGGYHSPLASCVSAGTPASIPRLAETQREADILENIAIERYRNRRRSRPSAA
jgi:uncharacterized OB-fold protein